MARIAYVNGRYAPHQDAMVHVEDRGYQFADGVYEVVAVAGGTLVDEDWHLDRLERSLRELRIAEPMPRAALRLVMREVIRRNLVADGMVYMQMTRGVAPRDHVFPKKAATSIVVTARRKRPPAPELLEKGAKAISIPDIRWARCDIKSVSLLPNVLGKQQAIEAGAYEAFQVDRDGYVTEGTATNAWIVTGKDELVTRNAGPEILNGITRLAVIEIAKGQSLRFVERRFTLAEAKAAREAFVSGSTAFVMPIVQIDEATVGDGQPGKLTRALRQAYIDRIDGKSAA